MSKISTLETSFFRLFRQFFLPENGWQTKPSRKAGEDGWKYPPQLTLHGHVIINPESNTHNQKRDQQDDEKSFYII